MFIRTSLFVFHLCFWMRKSIKIKNVITCKTRLKVIKWLLLSMVILALSCRTEVTNNIRVMENNNLKKDSFKLSLYVKAEKEDFFDFFYVVDSVTEKFSEDRKIRCKLKAGNTTEIIIFELKEGCPLKFRIDLGRNLEQKSIELQQTIIRCGSKSIVIPGNISEHFFIANRYLEFSKKGDTINFLRKRGNKTPFITSSALLNKKMKLEFR